ncbi:hypothetical protein CEXT_92101 [Caerostris extrusa]|uniref:Uncharacterized protein n=1 Tax=Caerostris extrusa TaxID=172846 RepID=A0AAV4WKV0_CAEEX|nr:hypothetical protein CEXT_92101 [Caerostris extrusa]
MDMKLAHLWPFAVVLWPMYIIHIEVLITLLCKEQDKQLRGDKILKPYHFASKYLALKPKHFHGQNMKRIFTMATDNSPPARDNELIKPTHGNPSIPGTRRYVGMGILRETTFFHTYPSRAYSQGEVSVL